MESILAVNVFGKTRRATLNGRSYLVAPSIILVSGVLNGSKGALYYPPDEVKKEPHKWNHIPIVVNHPIMNGVPVSGRNPQILDKYWIGHVYKTTPVEVTKGKLKGAIKLWVENWFDEESTKRVDTRIWDALERGVPIELSTGLLTDNEPAVPNSSYNGTPYLFTARNYRPDHLAILPDNIGACSIKDGCGVLVNQAAKKWLAKRSGKSDNKKDPSYDPEHPEECCPNCGARLERGDDGNCNRCGKPWPLTANQLHQYSIGVRNMDKAALVTWLTINCDCWKEEKDKEVLNTFSETKLQKMKSIVEKAKQDAQFVANAATSPPTPSPSSPTSPSTPSPSSPSPSGPVTPSPTPSPSGPKSMTTNEWLASASAEIQSAVRNAMAIEQRERDSLIQRYTELTTNAQNKESCNRMITKMKSMCMEDLRDTVDSMSSSMGSMTDNQAGQFNNGISVGNKPIYFGEVYPPTLNRGDNGNNGTVTGSNSNTNNSHVNNSQDDILIPPTINWEEEYQLQRRKIG